MATRPVRPNPVIRLLDGGTLPITKEVLRKLLDATDPDTVAGTRDRLLLALGWTLGAGRTGLAALRIDDIRVVRKTLRIRQGDGEVVCTDPELVDLYRAWLTRLGKELGKRPTEGPLFRAMANRYGELTDSISPHTVHEIVRAAIQRADLPEPGRYRTHSLVLGHRAHQQFGV